MVKYIYSTGFGSFVFENSRIIGQILFKDPASANCLLEKREPLKEEKTLEKQYHAEILKKPTPEILDTLRKFKKEYYSAGMQIIKSKLRNSLTEDILVIQAIHNIEESMKVANLLSKRLREWYELYLPEFSNAVEDHEKFSEIILKKTKKELLEQIKLKDSIGSDIKKEDLDAILNLAKELTYIYKFIETQKTYLDSLMKRCCPNITAIAGSLIAGKLVAIASGLKRLMEFPSSTVQLLGAEKALFRHMKNKKYLPPKYGVLHEHPLIAQARKENKGKVARILADKISIASKVDYFKGEFVGDELMRQVQKKVNNLR